MTQRTSVIAPPKQVFYPSTDGKPMAEDTRQFEWIVTINGGLSTQFAEEFNVFIASDLFWYPVEGNNKIRVAADVMVAFGRPRGHRRSYLQWNEGGIAPQVVMEILSRGNRTKEMLAKFGFYERHGVEECYFFDPEVTEVLGWIREGDKLREIRSMQGWVSPRLQIRFEVIDGLLQIFGRDGKRFATFEEVAQEKQRAEQKQLRAEREKQQAELAQQQAELAKQQAESAKQQAEREKQQMLQQHDEQARSAERLREQLRALGVNPDA
jgi:Uma2 family endonuclease